MRGHAALLGVLPPDLDPVYAAAVDPLEIAAALEAAGVSNGVVQTVLGRADLFDLAEELYGSRLPRPVPLQNRRRTPRSGGLEDLALGLLFVVPALSLAVAARTLHLALPWWVFPLALTIGWAFGQATARSAACLHNQGVDPGPTVVPSLVLTVATGFAVALATATVTRAGTSAVVTITLFCAYVASLTVLSVYRESVAMAASLAPVLVCSVAYLVSPSGWTRVADVVAVGATIVIALSLALRHAEPTWWSPLALGTYERQTVLTFFAYGAGCGIAVSVVTVMARGAQSLGPLSLVALPVMLSLGVLEWQLHSFRARAARAMHASGSLEAFERRALGNLAKSTGWYVAALVALSTVVIVARLGGGQPVPLLSLVAEDVLGVTLFIGMVMAMCSALHLGVRSWVIGAGAFAAGLVAVHLMGLGADRTALQAVSLVGALTALSVMAVGARGVVRIPFHFLG